MMYGNEIEIWVTEEFLAELFSEGKKFEYITVTKGLPESARLVSARYDLFKNAVVFTYANCGDLESPFKVEWTKEYRDKP